MFAVRRRAWLLGALSIAAFSLHASPGTAAACSVGPGWDLFRTNVGTRYNPVAAAVEAAGLQPPAATDTIVERRGFASPPAGVVPIELVALQLQANGVAGIGGNAPVFVTLQSRRGVNPLDPPPGPRSTGLLNIQFASCSDGIATASFTVYFDVRVGSVTGPIVWTSLIPEDPTVFIEGVNRGIEAGDFYLGAPAGT